MGATNLTEKGLPGISVLSRLTASVYSSAFKGAKLMKYVSSSLCVTFTVAGPVAAPVAVALILESLLSGASLSTVNKKVSPTVYVIDGSVGFMDVILGT